MKLCVTHIEKFAKRSVFSPITQSVETNRTGFIPHSINSEISSLQFLHATILTISMIGSEFINIRSLLSSQLPFLPSITFQWHLRPYLHAHCSPKRPYQHFATFPSFSLHSAPTYFSALNGFHHQYTHRSKQKLKAEHILFLYRPGVTGKMFLACVF